MSPSTIIMLLGIFGHMRDGNSKWRRFHNEELHSLFSSPNMVRMIESTRLRWTGHVARMEEDRSAFKILTGKTMGKKPLLRHWLR